jgi:hypothetical protein
MVPATAVASLVFLVYLLTTGFNLQGAAAAAGVAVIAFCAVEVGRTGGREGMFVLQLLISLCLGGIVGFYGGSQIMFWLVQGGRSSGAAFLSGLSVVGSALGIVVTIFTLTILVWRRWPPLGIIERPSEAR